MMRKNSRGQTEQERLQILEERLSEYLYDVYFKYEPKTFFKWRKTNTRDKGATTPKVKGADFIFSATPLSRYLLTDPKQRKVIICESPLAPIALKQAIARVLFDKLQVHHYFQLDNIADCMD